MPLPILRRKLLELERKGAVASFPGQPDGKGRPVNVYKMLQADEAIESIDKADIEDIEVEEDQKRDYALLKETVRELADRYSRLPVEAVKKMYAEAAVRLLREDPVLLLKEFATWLRDEHERQVRFFRDAVKRHNTEEADRRYAIIDRLETLADRILNGFFGIPSRHRNPSSDKVENGPYLLEYISEKDDYNTTVDIEEVERYLRISIFGKSVFEERPAQPIEKLPIHIGGSDASVQSIDLATVLPWRLDSRILHIITAVGTRYDVLKSESMRPNLYPEPRLLARYERKQAVEEGLLIPPLLYEEEMENRIRQAAMDLRQYHKDEEMMFKNDPVAKIHFRDGRVFPMEHTMDDAIQRGLHGKLVRASLKMFKSIVNQVGAAEGEVLCCGFVKRTGIDWLAPLVKWYMGFGSKRGGKLAIDPEMDADDFVKRTTDDSTVAAYLFSGLKEKTGSKNAFISFRALRRFHTMDKNIRDNPPTIDVRTWRSTLEDKVKQNHNARDDGVDDLATLCARGAVVSFYTSVPNIDPAYEATGAIPRVEILVPYGDLEDFPNYRKFESREIGYVQRILDIMFHNGILDPYNDALFWNPKKNPKIFLVPKTVRDAHRLSKSIAKIFRDDFTALLVKEARIYWSEGGQQAGK